MIAWSAAAASLATADEPLPVHALPREPTWFAPVEGGSPVEGPDFAGGKVFVSTTTGVAVYPRTCSAECEPLWRSDLPTEWLGYQVDASAGYVAVSVFRRLSVFDAACADDGSICSPLWSASRRVFRGHIVGSSVVAMFSMSEGVRLAVFPLACSDPCTPTWTRLLRGEYPNYSPPVLAHGVLYVRRGSVLYGVSMGCTDGAGRCAIVFRVGHIPDATYPAVARNLVIFGTGRGPDDTELAAYPAGCGHDCRPTWTADAGGYVEGAPTLAGRLVATSSTGRIVAFPLACGSPCTPAWVAEIPGYAPINYGDDERVVAVSHRGDRAIYAFPTDCAADCEPAWSHRYGDRSNEPKGTAVDGRHVFVALPDRVLAYRLSTGGRSWSGSLHPGEGWWLDVGGRSLVAYLRASGSGTLDAFIAEP